MPWNTHGMLGEYFATSASALPVGELRAHEPRLVVLGERRELSGQVDALVEEGHQLRLLGDDRAVGDLEVLHDRDQVGRGAVEVVA